MASDIHDLIALPLGHRLGEPAAEAADGSYSEGLLAAIDRS